MLIFIFVTDKMEKCGCKLCDDISKEAKNKAWCFKWLKDLDDLGNIEQDLKNHVKLRLAPRRLDTSVSDIRAKLAILQTKTVRFCDLLLLANSNQ